jgi:hypothetical protein
MDIVVLLNCFGYCTLNDEGSNLSLKALKHKTMAVKIGTVETWIAFLGPSKNMQSLN